MLESQTTFIVGAGACADLRLPTGAELRKDISSVLSFEFDNFGRLKSGDWMVHQAIRIRAGDQLKDYFLAARHISKEVLLARSIDDFIDANEGDAALNFCGKLAIARSILKAERKSSLYAEWRPNGESFPIEPVQDGWMAELFRILQVSKKSVESIFDNIDFVVFNYDRCVEHFFFHAIKRFYRLSDVEASEVMAKLNVVHPYGRLGALPWMPKDQGVPVAFGLDAEARQLVNIADSVRTYTEQIEDDEALTRIRQRILEADKLVFIGFAFHKQNMKLLHPGEDTCTRRVYATAYRFPPTEVELAEKEIDQLCGKGLASGREIHLKDLGCNELIRDYARAIQYA